MSLSQKAEAENKQTVKEKWKDPDCTENNGIKIEVNILNSIFKVN